MNDKREMARHLLASLAYRTQKAVRGAPEGYADFRTAPDIRTPHELLHHMTAVTAFARRLLKGDDWEPEILPTFAEEIARFHEVLRETSDLLASDVPLEDERVKRLLQGPFSDAMTHAGQLAMMRRLAGCPIPPENFFEANVKTDNVGSDQPLPVQPDPE